MQAPRYVLRVRWASGVTKIRQRAVGVADLALAVSKITPLAWISWGKMPPNWSLPILPMKPARPPREARPAIVLAAEPPETSMAAPITEYKASARAASTNV